VLALTTLPSQAQVDILQPAGDQPIDISAQAGNSWRQGQYEVWLLQGDCVIRQGPATARSALACLWIDRSDDGSSGKVIAYLEGDVRIEGGRDSSTRLVDKAWFGRFHATAGLKVAAGRLGGKPDVMPAVYQRAVERWQAPAPGTIRRTEYRVGQAFQPDNHVGQAFQPDTGTDRQPVKPAQYMAPLEAAPVVPTATRRIRVFSRGDVPVQAQWFPDPNSRQWIAVIDGGVNLIVDGLLDYGALDISADRLVIWTTGLEEPDLTGQRPQTNREPLELYMEGSIVFRQGERIIHANRMYYDVAREVGTVLEAEMLTPAPSYEGLLRLKAAVVQQLGRGRYFAQDSFITSSRMGSPGYRIQSGDIHFEDQQFPAVEPFTGRPLVDPVTGEQIIEHQRLATARNNFLFLGPLPVFYWPALTTDLIEPTFYIRNARLKNDSVFGNQVLTTWNMYELLNIKRPPEGTDWDASFDYLSKRGFGHGTTFVYDRDWFFGRESRHAGLIDYWGIKDYGLDNLGQGRSGLQPETDYRHRLFVQHRQQLAGGMRLTGEAGWISDRNFLEEYFENEWDELKDEDTGVELKKLDANVSWSVIGYARLNDFFTQTQWLPRADHFLLGQRAVADWLTWYEHTNLAYAELRPAVPPSNPADGPWNPLPYEVASQGERIATRHEIDLPLQLGPVKFVPFALGEFAHWAQDINGDDLQRFYWQTGLRASMPMWRVDPTVEMPLLNVHGLAHKVVFDAEFAYAESNRDLSLLPLYDPLDDDNVEAFRRRFQPALPQVLPPQLDPRSYALRSGLGSWVTSPSTEVADDLATFRLGMRHRWQTKRGMPGKQHIIDWITLDTNATIFPDPERDNFDKLIGLVDYDFRWHVGDRLTLTSDGAFDFFDQGQQVVNVGGFLSRPPRGSLYVGMRLIDGPVTSRVVSTSYSYWMSPKWVSTLGASMDLGTQGNIGESFTLTRIGESLLVSVGVSVDHARDNVGVQLAIEPRFLPKSRLRTMGGTQIPIAGAYGLE